MTKASKREPSEVRRPKKENPRHELVVNALMTGHTESDAMRAAGYHPANAQNVMRHENVQQLLAEARGEISEITTIQRLDVMNIFLEAIDMARTLADPANMISGADKLAKMMGYYAPEVKKIEVSNDVEVLKSKFQQMSDDELLEVLANRGKVIDGEVLQ